MAMTMIERLEEHPGTYFLCRRSEVPGLLEKAREEAEQILSELQHYYTGDFCIVAYEKRHIEGCSIAGDLLVSGEVCRTFDPIDLLFLELNELMITRICQMRESEEQK